MTDINKIDNFLDILSQDQLKSLIHMASSRIDRPKGCMYRFELDVGPQHCVADVFKQLANYFYKINNYSETPDNELPKTRIAPLKTGG